MFILQIDFHSGGAVPIPGADEDSERIAAMISNNMDSVSDIFVTMQSRHVRDRELLFGRIILMLFCRSITSLTPTSGRIPTASLPSHTLSFAPEM